MGKDNIEKYSALYSLLKKISGFWHDKIFYRKIIVVGRENIKPDCHLILAPNHQNALLDALAVLFTMKGQPVFLARADIFKNKFIASLLYFLKILPVYRIRDGFSNLKANDEIFRKTIDVIRNKNGLVILPEGDHAGFRRLRQLKKGICRVAFQAEEAMDFNLNIKIIPVGLEYTNYSRFRQVLTVVYGKMIEVSDYHDLYRTNQEKALNELRNRLAAEMKNVMVHIESEKDYEAIDELRNIINGRYSDDIKNPKLFRDRKLIARLNGIRESNPNLYDKICSLSLDVKKKSTRLQTSYRLLEKKNHPLGFLLAGILSLIISLPLYVFGNIFTLTFLKIPELQIRKIKDHQFHGSLKFGYSFGLALILLPVYLIIALLIIRPWWLALLISLMIPLAGIFAWNYIILIKRIIGGFRIRKYIKNKNRDFISLRKSYDELTGLIAQLEQ